MSSQRPIDGSADQLSEADPSLVYSALAVADRRFVVAMLADRGESLHLSAIADALAARKHDSESVPQSTVRSVTTALYHVHAPKLADAGIVDYDRETERVALAVDADAVREVVALPSVE
ncbi:DUF7344 domain-containing protein [Halosimplex halophilum]|uniref:DUF7344 domain-containing protein n=1 Tax=Halosimplex halophilum TaxID=2559572 RepID=UPI00107F4DE2|nr:hypothetical protein [Halosimplex halophilum]